MKTAWRRPNISWLFLLSLILGIVTNVAPVWAQNDLKLTKIPLEGESYDVAVGFGSVWALSKGAVFRIDPNTHQVVATIKGIPEFRSDWAHIATGAKAVWVTCRKDLMRLDPSANQVVAKIPTQSDLFGLVVYQEAVWVSQPSDGMVLKIDPRTNKVAAKIKVGGRPEDVIAGEGSLWILETRDKEIIRIDPSTKNVLARIELDQKFRDYGITLGKGAVWATPFRGPLYRIDPTTNKITHTYKKGAEYQSIIYEAGFLWSGWKHNLYQIKPETGEIFKTIEDGRLPPYDTFRFACDYEALWVPSGDRVMKIGKIKCEAKEEPIPPPPIGQLVINQIDISKFPDVVLYVSVFDNAGNLIKGLQQQDFKVLEDEVDQSPLTLTAELPALAAVMVVDTSGSMRKALPQVQKAAISFVNNMRGEDQVQLIQFAEKVNVSQPFTTDKAALEKAIRATKARGNTALYDAAFQAADSFGAMKGRKAIILITDGKDDDGYNRPLSKKTLRDVVIHASEVNVPIYTIGLGTEVDTPVLQKMATDSGGRYFPSPTTADLEGLYRQIVAQLEGQYRISYTTNLTERDGSVHRVVVRAGQSMGDKTYKSPTE